MARPSEDNPNGEQIRPKQTSEVINKLEQALSIGSTTREACYYAEIAESTYYHWVKEDPELLEKFNRLKERPVLTARKTVVDAIKTDSNLALKYLERKRPDEFTAHTKSKIVTDDGEGGDAPITSINVTNNFVSPDGTDDK